MILMLNNKDSFVYNLARYLVLLDEQVKVCDSDGITVRDIAELDPKAIIISPGPCTPDEAGVSIDAIRHLGGHIPILGVCLGHQAIAAAFGWRIARAHVPSHGRALPIRHQASGLFKGLPSPLAVGLYHSLIAEMTNAESGLIVDATSPAGEVMALSHKDLPIYGVQFHPESILTQMGSELLGNFLRLAETWRRS